MRRFKPSKVQTLTALAVLLAGCVGLAFHTGTGSYSSFGVGEFFLLCPLGGLEALLASKSFIPQALISLGVVVVLAAVFGRSWCAWGCPARLVRGAFNTKAHRLPVSPCAGGLRKALRNDSRLWVLAIVLVAALVIGFPVFCLLCPIGLTFGTVASIWRAIQYSEVNVGLLLFPAALVVELVAFKRWCVQVCPIAALLSLCSRATNAFTPKVNASTCLRANGGDCHKCFEACPEAIDLHRADARLQLADCTRCAECLHVCPTESVSMPFIKHGRVLEVAGPEGGSADGSGQKN